MSPPLEARRLQLQAQAGGRNSGRGRGAIEGLSSPESRPWNVWGSLSQRRVDKGLSRGPDLAMEREAPRPAASLALSRGPLGSFPHFLVLSGPGGPAGALGEVLPEQQEAGEKVGEVFLGLFALPPPPQGRPLCSQE